MPSIIHNPLKLRIVVLILICIIAAITFYNAILLALINAVINRDGSSHGIFIPFISAYFIWIKRSTLRQIEPQYGILGIPLLLFSISLSYLNIGGFHVGAISFFFFVAGTALLLLGHNFFKEIAFPIFFLTTMIPIPCDFYKTLADCTRAITFTGASWVVSMFGMPFLREGYLFHLPGVTLSVAQGCSGIRYLVSYFVFSLAYAYLFRITVWSRLGVVASSLPISLVASICRLTAIFTLTHTFGPKMAEYWPHVFISWAVFLTFLFLAITLDHFFQSRPNKFQEKQFVRR